VVVPAYQTQIQGCITNFGDLDQLREEGKVLKVIGVSMNIGLEGA
jgi:hypothetical protein